MAPLDWVLVVSTGIVGVFGLCCLFDGARRIALHGANSASSYLIAIGAVLSLALAGYAYWQADLVDVVMWLVWGVSALVFGALFAREPAPQPVVEADTITITKIEPVLAPSIATPAPQPAAAPAKPVVPMAPVVPAKPAAPVAPAVPAAPAAAKPVTAPPAAPPRRAIGEDTVPLRKPSSVGGDTVPLAKPVGEDTVPLPKPGIPSVTTPLAKPASVGEDTVPLAKPAPGTFTPPKKP